MQSQLNTTIIGTKFRKAKLFSQKSPFKANKNMNKYGKIKTGLKRKSKIKNIQDDFMSELNIADSLKDSSLTLRKRWKTLNEREVLECYFELDPNWSRRTILYIKDLVHLSEKQIYKWGYEKRRRLNPHTPQEKIVDMKYVTKINDLTQPLNLEDLNHIVSSLFPEEESEEEALSDETKEIYNHVRNQLIKRSVEYDAQSDLDKLLTDRIPIQNLAIEAKRSLNYK